MAHLNRIYLLKANLSGAILSGADLKDANLWDTNLVRADLRGANLRNANLRNANLRNANLSNANLSGARNWTEEQLVQISTLDEATMPDGASDQVVRTVTENSQTLKFTSHGFEKE